VIETATIKVRHNIEVAHRLFETPGKCENIHGHSMWVTMELFGEVNQHGMLEGLDFGDVKKIFRSHLDTELDHHLLLNQDDPWAGDIYLPSSNPQENALPDGPHQLPGLVPTPGDPTTENIASWLAHWALEKYPFNVYQVVMTVDETHVNSATCTLQR
jgi:6-pyruvoyltetrahydropterin/6-carboxytetrahydropterin synthase